MPHPYACAGAQRQDMLHANTPQPQHTPKMCKHASNTPKHLFRARASVRRHWDMRHPNMTPNTRNLRPNTDAPFMCMQVRGGTGTASKGGLQVPGFAGMGRTPGMGGVSVSDVPVHLPVWFVGGLCPCAPACVATGFLSSSVVCE
eukprot:1161782-Pelagomonas_calceolata.AAC.2